MVRFAYHPSHVAPRAGQHGGTHCQGVVIVMKERMEVRYLPGPAEVDRMNTAELRRNFLVRGLFQPGRLNLLYTDLERLVIGGVMPTGCMPLSAFHELGTEFFLERREMGVMNLGEPGTVHAGGRKYTLERLDCLYLGMGAKDVCFEPVPSGEPAFYLASCPAHQSYPTRKLTREEARSIALGDPLRSAQRRIYQYIGPDVMPSCQLALGFTELEPGSVWNTMPPHTHSRRSEIYLYFQLEDDVVMHFMGEPERTRHLIVRDREAVLSPPWSIHSGAGTRNYRFLWVMAGDNQVFEDMDPLNMADLA